MKSLEFTSSYSIPGTTISTCAYTDSGKQLVYILSLFTFTIVANKVGALIGGLVVAFIFCIICTVASIAIPICICCCLGVGLGAAAGRPRRTRLFTPKAGKAFNVTTATGTGPSSAAPYPTTEGPAYPTQAYPQNTPQYQPPTAPYPSYNLAPPAGPDGTVPYTAPPPPPPYSYPPTQ